MIGSQPSLLRRIGWSRWLALGVLLAIVIGLQASGSHRASAVTHTYQVNSTADTDDGSCDAFSVSPPKDCTLREAINVANATPNTGVLPDLDIITFLPSVFTVASPGTINLTASLPTIVDDLRINAAGSGVKIDGGGTYDGLNVVADNADFRFEILASTGHFILQGLAGDGVDLDGDGYSFGIVIIDGAQVGAPSHDVSGDGIDLYNTPDVNTVTITNNEITAGSVGVDVNVGLGSLSDNSVSINSNSITAYDNAVYVDFAGNLASTVTLNVNSNSNLVSTGYDAVDLNFCGGSSCAIGTSTVSTLNFNVNENANIHGYYDGVDITINADDGSDNAHVNVNVNNLTQSGNITGDDGEAVDVYSNVCCEYSNSIANINVNGNSTGGVIRDLRGTDDGVNVWSRTCCGESNESHVGVKANRDVSGANGNGVIVFSGAGDDGGNSTADASKSTVNVDDNRDVSGALDGVNIFAGAGGDGSDDADGTSASASVSRNRDISGGGGYGNDGVQTDVGSGGDYMGGGSGSTNISTTNVDGNRTITGKDAVHIGSYACCNDSDASETGNKNVVSVSDNTGLLKGSDDGIVIDGVGLYGTGFNDYVCCAAANTIAISDNNKIFGDKSTSDGENGIEISICGDPRIGDSQQDCMDAANTALTISGNDISDSGQDGINVCCGSFSGSQISGNLIQRNADDGVHLTDTLGVKVGPTNTISGNGGSPDAGIVIDAYDFGLSPNPVAGANTITQNSISGNNGLGIDLGDDGVGCDISTFGNPNGCLKPPTLTIMTGAKLVGHAHAGSTVEIFKANESPPDNESGDDPQHGEGEVYQTSVAADSDGNFSVGLCGLTAGTRITATQTNGVGNTSEFSGNLILPATLGACVPTATPSFTPTKTATPTRTVTGTPPTATPTITETPTVTETPPPATDTPVPPTATITPIPPTHTATPIAKPCGDVNDDGVANSVDSALVLQLEAGLVSSLANMPSADVNNDDHVNSVDAALILQYVAALISGLNC